MRVRSKLIGAVYFYPCLFHFVIWRMSKPLFCITESESSVEITPSTLRSIISPYHSECKLHYPLSLNKQWTSWLLQGCPEHPAFIFPDLVAYEVYILILGSPSNIIDPTKSSNKGRERIILTILVTNSDEVCLFLNERFWMNTLQNCTFSLFFLNRNRK